MASGLERVYTVSQYVEFQHRLADKAAALYKNAGHGEGGRPPDGYATAGVEYTINDENGVDNDGVCVEWTPQSVQQALYSCAIGAAAGASPSAGNASAFGGGKKRKTTAAFNGHDNGVSSKRKKR